MYMKCPKCGNNYCNIISNTKTSGTDYSLCGGILGEALFGPVGFLCGLSDSRNMTVETYWQCKRCGYKFKT